MSDKKNASYIGTKSKLWPNSMPFKTKPIAPLSRIMHFAKKVSKKQVSYKFQLAQQKLKKTTQSKVVVARQVLVAISRKLLQSLKQKQRTLSLTSQ